MKNILFVSLCLLLFAVGCSQSVQTSQKIISIGDEANESSDSGINASVANTDSASETETKSETKTELNTTIATNTSAPAKPLVEKKEEPEIKPIFIDSSKNISVSSTDGKKYYSVKGTVHTIEVIDVTEDADACLIRVDDAISLVDEGSTETINGVKIHVLDAHAFRSQLQDNDVCYLIIY